nr:2626_t:CDS:10 [Entrophospora candida]
MLVLIASPSCSGETNLVEKVEKYNKGKTVSFKGHFYLSIPQTNFLRQMMKILLGSVCQTGWCIKELLAGKNTQVPHHRLNMTHIINNNNKMHLFKFYNVHDYNGDNNKRLFHSPVTVYKDYYRILGLQKNVNKSDIKKAYYMLAKKNHPDTNKDPTAKELFVTIQEAYDVLSDDQKRIQYDQLGVLYNGKRSPSSGVRFNVENIGGFSGGYDEENFNNIFGERLAGSKINTGFKFGQPYSKGVDVEVTLDISFLESVRGVKKMINAARTVNCKSCRGFGTKNRKRPELCIACKGSGIRYISVSLGIHNQEPCANCSGKGTKISDINKCPDCSGKGHLKEKKLVAVNIPSGVENGTKIKLVGNGDGVPPGDLYVKLGIIEDDTFKRQGANIIIAKDISLRQAIMGGNVTVPTIYGDIEINIPEGSQPNQKIVMKEYGMKIGNFRGDQLVILKVKIPKNITAKQKQLLRKLVEADEENL